MPELPEVEVLVRHLDPLVRGKTIRSVVLRRPKYVLPTPPGQFCAVLPKARLTGVNRRGKYLLLGLQRTRPKPLHFTLLAHLGMTGRIYLVKRGAKTPKHAVVELDLGDRLLVFEDPRYFGRLTLDLSPLDKLGPEPDAAAFSAEYLRAKLKRCRQAIKVKLLDQSLVAGVGNIYASEALHRAGLSPRRRCHRLTLEECSHLRDAIRQVLAEAIQFGSTVPLDYAGTGRRDRLFYYGRAEGALNYYEERLRVYDKAGRPCPGCGAPIKRIIQAARSTYYCPRCQRG